MSERVEISKIWNKKVEDLSPVEYAIWRLPVGSTVAIEAAEELSALHARIEELEGLLGEANGHIGYLAFGQIHADRDAENLHNKINKSLGIPL